MNETVKMLNSNAFSLPSRPSMSHGTGLGQDRYQERDFVLATPEEFCKRFGGTKVINKVNICYFHERVASIEI